MATAPKLVPVSARERPPRPTHPSTEELGAKLSPDLREFVDRVIVPALLREYLAEQKSGNCVAVTPRVVAHSEPHARLSAEGVD